jgi:hypothetical protein
LLDVVKDGVSHVQKPLESHPGVPLLVHARCTRDEILPVSVSAQTLE